jgi:hypothetical protein
VTEAVDDLNASFLSANPISPAEDRRRNETQIHLAAKDETMNNLCSPTGHGVGYAVRSDKRKDSGLNAFTDRRSVQVHQRLQWE